MDNDLERLWLKADQVSRDGVRQLLDEIDCIRHGRMHPLGHIDLDRRISYVDRTDTARSVAARAATRRYPPGR